MKELFKKRRLSFLEQEIKYARYVFNDHFVLFLLIFMGFVSVQYSQLLRNFPENPWVVILGLLLFSAFIVPWGRFATYLEPADRQFLLVKEEELLLYFKERVRRAYLFWGAIQTGLLVLLAPLFLALGLPFWGFTLYALLLLGLKYWIFQRRSRSFIQQGRLAWEALIAYEAKRKQGILRFFALFTNVKGISNSIKRRAYLDFLTSLVKKQHQETWTNLYLRSYLRNGDLFALSLRLLLLSLLLLIFIPQAMVAASFTVLFNYLMIFQLLALYEALDYQYLTQLFPLEPTHKVKGVKKIIRALALLSLALESLFALLFFQEKIWVLAILGLSLVLVFFYLPFKLKRLVDEKG
ncbi:ABC transporter permease [Streptococcus oricebi]|uniref:Multidrug ABC transporter permease n=1 Tax=Streptococcus oricebi TaxID=1547447 RepID=A0ABS5B3W5_9STRE|nr:ABC transporter permease [Streptococcus oricebi]MBP2623518.1 multidrug ABC transporter permease [Streptococcus oricebi]